MAAHSSILAWKIPWTEELGRLQSMGSQSQTRLKQLSSSIHFRIFSSPTFHWRKGVILSSGDMCYLPLFYFIINLKQRVS